MEGRKKKTGSTSPSSLYFLFPLQLEKRVVGRPSWSSFILNWLETYRSHCSIAVITRHRKKGWWGLDAGNNTLQTRFLPIVAFRFGFFLPKRK